LCREYEEDEGAAGYGGLGCQNSSERGGGQSAEKLEGNKMNDEKAPAAVRKLKDKGYAVMKLTVAEIESVLFSVYNITMDGSKLRKADYVSALEKEMSTNTLKYESFVCNVETILVSEATVIVAGECRAESGTA
jgi:hypothetical protein